MRTLSKVQLLIRQEDKRTFRDMSTSIEKLTVLRDKAELWLYSVCFCLSAYARVKCRMFLCPPAFIRVVYCMFLGPFASPG